MAKATKKKTAVKKASPKKTAGAKKTVKKTATTKTQKAGPKKLAAKTKSPKRPAPKKLAQPKPQGPRQPIQRPTPLTATGSNVLWKLLAKRNERKAQGEGQQNEAFNKMVDKASEKERFANHQARFSRFAGPRRRAS